MTKVFRKIRNHLVYNNKIRKYFFYAIGEIILVVIGILIALYIDNRNQKKTNEKEFDVAIEQISTHLHSAIELDKWDIEVVEKQIEICQFIKDNLDTISNESLLRKVHYLDWISGAGFKLDNYDSFIGKLKISPEDRERNSILFHLTQFFNLMDNGFEYDFENFKIKNFSPVLKKNGIPLANGQVYLSILTKNKEELPLLSDYAIQKIGAIKTTPEFSAAILETQEKLPKLLNSLKSRKRESEAIRSMLLDFNPNLKLRYDGIAITGTALSDETIKMDLVDEHQGVWETNLEVKKGTIEIISSYAHYFSWGKSKNDNKLKFWGNAIDVEEGNYKLSINLEEMTYSLKNIPK